MRIFSYRRDAVSGVGVMVDDTGFVAVHEVAPELPRTLHEILAVPNGMERVRAAIAGKPVGANLDAVTLELPIPRPNAIWALALNFKAHIEETGLQTSAEYPQIFLRTAASLVAPGEPIQAPSPEIARAFDYEGELGVVIGRGGRNIPKERALEHVAGYCAFNEGSVREYQGHNRQFGLGKNFEASGSYGPWLMTTDEFGDPVGHEVITRLNGIQRQRSTLSDMLFPVAAVIAYLSKGYRLRPGDVIAMGTPGALPPAPGDTLGADLSQQFGNHKIPGRAHMRPGDIVEVEITGLGVLRNPIVPGASAAYQAS
jgi:2-keto-4-pentenoate hydratase/2-oxohepta-3-ene-1,7-dioic acid hydratase in catechol pathway